MSGMDIGSKEYVKYIEGLDCMAVKKHVAEQLIFGQDKFESFEGSILLINKTLKEIRAMLTPEKSYEHYKKNKALYKSEVEDKIIKRTRVVESVKTLLILGIGIIGFLMYVASTINLGV